MPLLPGGRIPKRSTGADCKSAGFAFTGSNPVPTTTFLLLQGKVLITLHIQPVLKVKIQPDSDSANEPKGKFMVEQTLSQE